MTGITQTQARVVVDAAAARADEIGVPMNIAVVDAGNNLTTFVRQDGAWLGSIDIAQKKAYTARAFDMTSAELGAEAQPGKPLYGIEASNDGNLIVFGGGIPLKDGDEIAGAIGVSGGTVDEDEEVAEAGVAGFSS